MLSITKILARNARLDQAIQYALNGDKTEHKILTAHQNCDPGREFRQMMDTKQEVGKLDGRQCYHIIQSFKPREITPELALEIAKEFASEYQKHPKYSGLMALYVHYLYVLGKIEKRQYPPRMTPRLRKEVMRAERYREQFAFLRDNGIATQEDMAAFQTRTEDTLAALTRQRTILNVRKKKRRPLYTALADVESLAQAKALYDEGLSGMEAEFSRYMDAVAVLERCGIPRERLAAEKAELYEQLAQVNREIRTARKKLALCKEIQDRLPQMEQTIDKIKSREHEKHNSHRGW